MRAHALDFYEYVSSTGAHTGAKVLLASSFFRLYCGVVFSMSTPQSKASVLNVSQKQEDCVHLFCLADPKNNRKLDLSLTISRNSEAEDSRPKFEWKESQCVKRRSKRAQTRGYPAPNQVDIALVQRLEE